jgi:hypothetical protein
MPRSFLLPYGICRQSSRLSDLDLSLFIWMSSSVRIFFWALILLKVLSWVFEWEPAQWMGSFTLASQRMISIFR